MNTTAKWAYFNIGKRAHDRSGRCLVARDRGGKIAARAMLYLN